MVFGEKNGVLMLSFKNIQPVRMGVACMVAQGPAKVGVAYLYIRHCRAKVGVTYCGCGNGECGMDGLQNGCGKGIMISPNISILAPK